MAIAYGALRRLVMETRCLCLFATHYHALAREFEHVNPFVALYHMACSVDNETKVTAIACRLHPARLFSHLLPSPNPNPLYSALSPSQPQPSPVFGMWQYHICLQVVTFLYRFLRGACSRSHGVHVARLAGLPAHVLDQAAQESAALEHEIEDTHVLGSIKQVLSTKANPSAACLRALQLQLRCNVW
mmetsp:Transcript_24258/g.75958  ORF Transcript_24258/g.75958 Transcript_24258/m.75958 type:complete len:187 (-) Transcript_24258:1467-2027(-)